MKEPLAVSLKARWVRLALGIGCALLIAAWVFSASRPGLRAEGCMEGCSSAGQRQEGPLRVASLNMLHEFPRFSHLSERLELIADEIGRLDPDIVCLQEVPWTVRTGSAARWLAARTGLNHVFLRANGNRRAILFEEGEAILSRYPLRDIAFTELEPQAGPFQHRVALQATALTPRGEVRVVCTHLTNGAPAVNHGQVESLRAFVERTAGSPAVVAGDFNALEGELEAATAGWIDTLRAAHGDDPGLTCCIDSLTAGPGEPLEERIDYLFLVPGSGLARVVNGERIFSQPAQVGAGWLWASDHVGLLVEIAP